jgi:hypothetical protein
MGALEGGAVLGVVALLAFLVKRILAGVYRRWEEEQRREDAEAAAHADAEALRPLPPDDLVKRLRNGGF